MRPSSCSTFQTATGLTTNALAGHEALGERPVIMAAMRADRENLRAGTHQHHFIVADMAKQGFACEFGRGYAL